MFYANLSEAPFWGMRLRQAISGPKVCSSLMYLRAAVIVL